MLDEIRKKDLKLTSKIGIELGKGYFPFGSPLAQFI
jgi:hypothetical protein